MCLMCSQLTPRFPVLAVSIKIFTKISIMRVRSVEGNCYFLIKRVGTYYGNAQATHPAKQIASKSGNKFHQISVLSFSESELTRRTKLRPNLTSSRLSNEHCEIVIVATDKWIFRVRFQQI